MKTIKEPERNIPVAFTADLCVIGGSCTGVFAAVRAARMGAKVAIVENNGFFGGVATAGLVTIWHSAFDMARRQQIVAGLSLEVIDRLKKRNAVKVLDPAAGQHCAYVFNPEELKIDLDELIAESGIRPFLHARFVDVIHDHGQVAAVIVEDKTGRRAIEARYFIDATGDGDLIVRMGLPFTKYDELQPPTTVAMVDNYKEIIRQNPSFDLSGAIHDPKYPGALQRGFAWGTEVVGRPESYMIAGSRSHNADCSDGDSLTAAEMECRRQVRTICDILRQAPGGAQISLANIATHIGVRETRHAKCLYTLCERDILHGTQFEDAIGYGTYGVDIHHSNKAGITMKYLDGTQRYSEPGKQCVWSRWRDESASKTPYYQIPYRSMVPESASNVLVAGRLVGADKYAYGAIRVMMNCNQTGEAAGVACCVAMSGRHRVSEVPIDQLRARLREGGSVCLTVEESAEHAVAGYGSQARQT